MTGRSASETNQASPREHGRVRLGPGARATVALLTVLVSCLWLGCGDRPKPPDLPAPMQVTTVGVGDVFELHIIGEEDLPTEYTVSPGGTIDVPYINRIKVAGLEPQEISDLVATRLKEEKILSKPVVVVNIKAYNSKRVEVMGAVKEPGSFPMQPGMTLLRVISQAGGFNSLADRSHVTIRRKVKGGTKAARVDVQAILDNEIPDVLLQAGDSIDVRQRVF